jgi:tetratricopeptide (TPR) repeat protein
MRPLFGVLVAVAVIAAPAAQSPDDLLSDTRLSVHTLVREDIFAGWRSDNETRLARGDRNVEILLTQRPAERANLLAWKAGTALYRAALAHEAGKSEAYARHYAEALAGFAEAAKATSGNGGVRAVTGGSFALFADRLPEPARSAGWAMAYENYLALWNEQGADIEKMPVHHKGEVLSGITQAAQRTGRTEEAARHLDRMLTVLAGTPYASLAQQWKATPALAATTNLTCRNCHAPGRLENKVAVLKKTAN